MDTLVRLKLSGFKSIRSADLVFDSLNILIGPNGAGKSNLISFVLAYHFGEHNVTVDVRAVETSRHRGRIHRGGFLDYQRANRDLERWMREDRNDDAFFTTMFDLYALPENFPCYAEARHLPPLTRVTALETAFHAEIEHLRFIPYIQLHEFEALLLADPEKFDWAFIEHENSIRQLIQLVSTFESPELIDDDPITAPSKRIIRLIPEYAGQKSSAGPLIAAKIGLPGIRAKCPHFDSRLQRIEALG
jgi:uncharacterized protein DUF4276/AAA domain-containing protein